MLIEAENRSDEKETVLSNPLKRCFQRLSFRKDVAIEDHCHCSGGSKMIALKVDTPQLNRKFLQSLESKLSRRTFQSQVVTKFGEASDDDWNFETFNLRPFLTANDECGNRSWSINSTLNSEWKRSEAPCLYVLLQINETRGFGCEIKTVHESVRVPRMKRETESSWANSKFQDKYGPLEVLFWRARTRASQLHRSTSRRDFFQVFKIKAAEREQLLDESLDESLDKSLVENLVES